MRGQGRRRAHARASGCGRTSLRFLVLFSSVSGRFGNRGQADYAAASEVLGRLAHELDRRWPARVVAIDWGPWRAAGMVSPWLERGVRPPRRRPDRARRRAARMLDEELSRGRKGEAEIVIGAAPGSRASGRPRRERRRAGIPRQAASRPRRALPRRWTRAASCCSPARASSHARPTGGARGGGCEALYTFDLERDRYLDDHRIDGRPVLPFAVAMELMARGRASPAAPGRAFSGLREIRLLRRARARRTTSR